MDWTDVFVEAQPKPGATSDDINTFVQNVCSPISSTEIQELTARHQSAVGDGVFDPPFDPSVWKLASRPFPAIYLEFLQYSNGGFFRGHHRDLDPFFSTHEVRDYMLGYSVPHWLPQALPFAFDGGGGFYLLDMRSSSESDEYPVFWSHACNLSFEDSRLLAASFVEFIQTGLGPE